MEIKLFMAARAAHQRFTDRLAPVTSQVCILALSAALTTAVR